MKKNIVFTLVAIASGIFGAFLFNLLFQKPATVYIQKEGNTEFRNASLSSHQQMNLDENFVLASAISTPSVVFIKTVSGNAYDTQSTFDWFFGGGGSNQVSSSGSGVIYSQDGYIMTNNHVIEHSETIEVVHEKRTYKAKVIGRDPSTDLAILKIDGKNLPAIKFASSKTIKVGEWVLAVGNPFNLTSTVTAGIISAKARNINIVNSQFPIESFIQTDAAINPGNSGGALVNTKGELIGINTAILSKTGSYTGYGFAVPSDIVGKVVKDLINFGEVQKAFAGMEVSEVNTALAEQLKLNDLSGVAITYLQKESAAEKAGLKKGDVILKLNEAEVNSKSTFEEYMTYYNPGDKIKITYKSGNSASKEATLVLTNREGTTEMLKRETYTSQSLGADLEAISKVEKDKLGITGGVRITNVKNNGLIRRLGIADGFVVTSINKIVIDNPEELSEILEKIRGKVVVEGITSNGVKGYYSYYF